MQRRSLLLTAGLAATGVGAWGAAPLDPIVVPRHEAMQDPQIRYLLRLLELAIQRSGQRYEVREAEQQMVQARSLIELSRAEGGIDVFWTMTDMEREQRFLPIRIPLDRGLLGWRLLLVRRADLGRFKAIRNLADLSGMQAFQMGDWPDTSILRANGLPVRTGTSFPGLFEQLALGRADYFPRSVLEIGPEAEAHAARDLVIEPDLLLHYPTALYLFVSPSRPELVPVLTRGLESLLTDGTLKQLFERQFGGLIDRYQLRRRRRIELKNPLLPPATPLARSDLWFSL